MLTFYELDLGLNHVVRKYAEPLAEMANHLISGTFSCYGFFPLQLVSKIHMSERLKALIIAVFSVLLGGCSVGRGPMGFEQVSRLCANGLMDKTLFGNTLCSRAARNYILRNRKISYEISFCKFER